ncbi:MULTISPECIES: HPr family phosphocarrier protein [unclassified Blautia]|uniref:HPr family phosphocarrier protein n=1 Tax=unclassified Blautia TaxID=2648079 RepID=UPI001C117928|nr:MULTISPECIES: HPr family phosphocarrier protein [unclassified Blautia]MDO5817724.1 HPr family phosphocarrier protein [Eubacteriales bacterium]MBU5679835.1 HPr family phosphocarrier protein [Blautia sp. MSJ-9]MCI6303286.1 HPr family phosphocarrier protein [Blautia sp.]MCI7449364.1 HPr family phosphocarrier protein [Blautia sp.]MDD6413948.1 HPr family phosphocarrier protein [Blautia sp.]
MVSFTYVIKDKLGIHARPGLLLVQEAGKLTSNITINKGAKSGDAKRMFCVMNLAVKQGDQITVQVEGENEAADAEVMKNFLEHNL